MTFDEMKALVQRNSGDAINKKDLSALDRDQTPDFLDHAAPPGVPSGTAGSKAWLSTLHRAFPDIEATMEGAIAEGDTVVVRKTWTGTHSGEFMDIAPTGKKVRFGGIVICRIENGRLAERWAGIDRLELMQQLGMALSPGAGGAA